MTREINATFTRRICAKSNSVCARVPGALEGGHICGFAGDLARQRFNLFGVFWICSYASGKTVAKRI